MLPSNPTTTSEEPPEDRFRTHWTGPHHPKAIAWAVAHDIGYDFNGNDRYIRMGPGAYSHHQVSGRGTDLGRLRDANDDYDDLVREIHANDQELGDGTKLVGGVEWYQATRGMKLRTLELWKLTNENVHRLWTDAVVALENEIKSLSGEDQKRATSNGELDELREDVIKVGTVLDLINRAHHLVLEEAEEGWNWKAGIKAQEDVIVEQNNLTIQYENKHRELLPAGWKWNFVREACGLGEGEDIKSVLSMGPDLIELDD